MTRTEASRSCLRRILAEVLEGPRRLGRVAADGAHRRGGSGIVLLGWDSSWLCMRRRGLGRGSCNTILSIRILVSGHARCLPVTYEMICKLDTAHVCIGILEINHDELLVLIGR